MFIKLGCVLNKQHWAPQYELLLTKLVLSVMEWFGLMREVSTMAPALIMGLCGFISELRDRELKERPLGSFPM